MIIALVIATLSQAVPLTDLSTLQAGAEYPPAAIRNGDTGTVRYELDIGPMGEVIGCTILASSGSAILDEASCESVRRARFQRPKTGDPASAKYQGSVRWSLDEREATAKPIILFVSGLAPSLIGEKTLVTYSVGANGRISDCKIASSSGDAKLDKFGCRLLGKNARFTASTSPQSPQNILIEWQPSD